MSPLEIGWQQIRTPRFAPIANEQIVKKTSVWGVDLMLRPLAGVVSGGGGANKKSNDFLHAEFFLSENQEEDYKLW